MPKKATWKKQEKAIKATQIAFELEQQVAAHIQQMAVKEGLTSSNQIRKLIGLSYSPPKRPRLTVSLSPDDYEMLGKKYKTDPSDTLAIKRKIMEELLGLMGDD
ncbi:hypothetical protein ACFL2V_09495 [Pseudomonadota bacterium]